MGAEGKGGLWLPGSLAVLRFSGAGLPVPLLAASSPAPRPQVPAPRPALFSTVILLSPFPVRFSAFAESLPPFNDAGSYRVLSVQHREVSTWSRRIPAKASGHLSLCFQQGSQRLGHRAAPAAPELGAGVRTRVCLIPFLFP